MKVWNKTLWKILAISFALLMVVSYATLSIAVDNPSTNNASKNRKVYGDERWLKT